eukprot:SAG31_NODE_51_length_30464_cov_16.835628_5_plen_133_part_00
MSATKAKLWEMLSENEQYEVTEWMLDTGASTTVAKTALNRWLSKAEDSTIILSGFSVDSAEAADKVGTLSMYSLPVNAESTGQAFDLMGVNTADKSRLVLLRYWSGTGTAGTGLQVLVLLGTGCCRCTRLYY